MRILKFHFDSVEQTRRDTQPTNHGMSHKRLSALTKNITNLPAPRKWWDIGITGESPGKRNKRRP